MRTTFQSFRSVSRSGRVVTMFYWLRILLLALMLTASANVCSAATAESRAFDKAAAKFTHGMWEFAAQDFGAFVTNFPTSFRVPEAILFQAEALIKNRNFEEGINLLSANRHRAGELGDLYLYWIAQGHLGQTNYEAAAQTFATLLEQFPESTNRMEAIVARASAFARQERWSKVTELLGATNSLFRSMAATNTSDWVPRGFLLLGEAQLLEGKPHEAEEAIAGLDLSKLKNDFLWQRWHLQTRIKLAENKIDDARAAATNLLAAAEASGNGRLRGETYSLIGSIFERTKSFDRAIGWYEQNLTNSVPVEQQRLALLKIAELSLSQMSSQAPGASQNQAADAVRRLERYQRDYPNSPAGDTVLLTLGELHLKQAVTSLEIATNQLSMALAQFDALLRDHPNSSLAGKALLGRGWCLWYAGDMVAAEAAFGAAIGKLPVSESQAVARFKLGDSYFNAKDFDRAFESYRELVATYETTPDIRPALLEQALYQATRAALAVTNLTGAAEAMEKLLDWYPNGLMGDRVLFLVAEGYARHSRPAAARELFERFENYFGPTNALLPQVRLAISRTYEREGNWSAAISNYNAWITTFPDHPQLAEAKFARAWDLAMSGADTNALAAFTSFVSDFPEHELAPRAKWWIGDYYFRQGNNPKAEENYPWTTNYANSELYFPAHLRAGMAAMARISYKDAISYFTALMKSTDPRCTEELRIKGALAAGDAYMARNEPGSTNRLSDLEEAAECFRFVIKTYPGRPEVPHAWGRLGDCFKEMASANPKNYERAIEAYNKVLTATNASTGTWRQAKVALGVVAEARAEKRQGPEQQELLKEALRQYSDAFFGETLRRNQADDLFWYQKAGMETAQLAERLGENAQAAEVYRTLLKIPNLSTAVQTTINRRLLKVREQTASAKP